MSSRPRRQALRRKGRTPAGRLFRVTRIGFLASARPSRWRGPFRVRRHVARNADGIWTGSAGTRRTPSDPAFVPRSFRACTARTVTTFRSGTAPDPVAKALAVRTSSPGVLRDLGIPTSVNACSESIDTDLAARIRQDVILKSYSSVRSDPPCGACPAPPPPGLAAAVPYQE